MMNETLMLMVQFLAGVVAFLSAFIFVIAVVGVFAILADTKKLDFRPIITAVVSGVLCAFLTAWLVTYNKPASQPQQAERVL